MEVDFSGKVFIKQGTIYSYGGNLTFWVKDKRPGGQPALVIITGTGKVILHDKDRADHVHAGGERDPVRGALAPAGLRGDPDPALHPPRRADDRPRDPGPRGPGHGRAVGGQQAARPAPSLPTCRCRCPRPSIITWSGGLTPARGRGPAALRDGALRREAGPAPSSASRAPGASSSSRRVEQRRPRRRRRSPAHRRGLARRLGDLPAGHGPHRSWRCCARCSSG